MTATTGLAGVSTFGSVAPETRIEMLEAALKRLGLYVDDEGEIKLISASTLAAWLAGENARPHPA